jgi:thiamine-phosphate pyrophosphorylase
LITDPEAPGGAVEPIARALGEAVRSRTATHPRGGALPGVAVQLRAKTWPARALFEAGERLRAITREAGARLVINGRLDVALAVGADGVHLPEGGLPPAAVRALAPDALVGASCHDARGLERAAREGADYAVLGPVGHVPGKSPPLGLEGFRALVAGARVPVLALGGVGAEDAPALLEAGAHGVAVIRAVARASDPAAALRALLTALDIGAARGR